MNPDVASVRAMQNTNPQRRLQIDPQTADTLLDLFQGFATAMHIAMPHLPPSARALLEKIAPTVTQLVQATYMLNSGRMDQTAAADHLNNVLAQAKLSLDAALRDVKPEAPPLRQVMLPVRENDGTR